MTQQLYRETTQNMGKNIKSNPIKLHNGPNPAFGLKITQYFLECKFYKITEYDCISLYVQKKSLKSVMNNLNRLTQAICADIFSLSNPQLTDVTDQKQFFFKVQHLL